MQHDADNRNQTAGRRSRNDRPAQRRGRPRRARCGLLLALALAGCVQAPVSPSAPATVPIAVVERGWHTDLCIAPPDAAGPLAALAADFPGVRFLCFGFGDRRYLLSAHRDAAGMLLALLPGPAALLMTALAAPPEAAFGAGNVVRLRLTPAGAAGLHAFLWRSLQTTQAGAPIRLGDGPYPGSVFYAASATYGVLANCNTWTADGLRAAGLPVGGAVLLAGQVMARARRIAAAAPQ